MVTQSCSIERDSSVAIRSANCGSLSFPPFEVIHGVKSCDGSRCLPALLLRRGDVGDASFRASHLSLTVRSELDFEFGGRSGPAAGWERILVNAIYMALQNGNSLTFKIFTSHTLDSYQLWRNRMTQPLGLHL